MKRLWLIILLCSGLLYAAHRYTNALIGEDSPYLQQHAHNPVNWYPWGEAALKKARKEHKLIFLSIGYSTCHWCHVMEEESFTDEAVAKLLNAHFISIKVDKEEYPQLDKKYQQLYMKLYGERGGWPLSVFLSPDGELLDIRTYIPKEEGYGSEGLLNLLPKLAAMLQNPQLMEQQIKEHQIQKIRSDQTLPPKEIETKMTAAIAATYDRANGGFASRPKFPEASKISLLLTHYRLTSDTQALKMATHTLTQMAHRGIYDQIGGGFFRYATDAAWQQPHFEKMLYTNAQMISVYVDAYLLTGEPLYKRVVNETIAAMETHYTRNGLFVSASDADSDGEEGGYYIFSYEDVKSDLLAKGWEPKALEAALAYWGIEEDGNIDGELSLPHVTALIKPPQADALRGYLRQRQAQRRFPFVDTKIITSWNAMMIKALFDASKIEPAYAEDAGKYLERLWNLMYRKGKLYHQTLAGKVPKQAGVLEDYAYLIGAFISGYERTYDERYLKRAVQLAKEAGTKFYKEGKWYLSDDGVEAVADFDDKYYTSPLSLLWDSMLSLAALQEDMGLYADTKKQIVRAVSTLTERDMVDASKLLYGYLRVQYGDVIIHATRDRLQDAQKAIDYIHYPFILSGVQASDAYVACRVNSCFAVDENVTRLIGKIETLTQPMQKKGAKRWQKK